MTTTARIATAEYSAPCLEAGPLSGPGTQLIASADALGRTPAATATRVRIVPILFDGLEQAFASGTDPVPWLKALLSATTAYCRETLVDRHAPAGAGSRDGGEIAEITGAHYGHLFREFSPSSYFDEPVELLRVRLQRNRISDETWLGKQVLDAGCGGGRYTVAWRMLGAEHATGLDVSASGIADARARVAAAGISGVTFDAGDTLALPYRDSSYDVVFSNGVLHHTTDWRSGVAELVRVLKPGGMGWLYVIENPGGLFWDVIEILRVLMRHDERDIARRALVDAGLAANRIFYMLDHVMVPINIRLTPAEVEGALIDSGATAIRRLTRGADFDRVEAIYRDDALATDKYGVGENRFVFSK